MKTILDVAKVARSKNSSPFELTLDVIFNDPADYEKAKTAKLITREAIAERYGVPLDRVKDVIHFDPAKAIKIGLLRDRPSGSPGDTDVYGAQQHGPLLEMKLDFP